MEILSNTVSLVTLLVVFYDNITIFITKNNCSVIIWLAYNKTRDIGVSDGTCFICADTWKLKMRRMSILTPFFPILEL